MSTQVGPELDPAAASAPPYSAVGRTDITLVELLRQHHNRSSHRRAIGDRDRTLTYGELWDAACRCAGGLRELSVSASDPVITMLDNSVDTMVAMVGLNFAGAVSVPTNTAYRGSLLAHVITESAAAVAVTEAPYVDRLLEAAGGAIHTVVVRGDRSRITGRDGVRLVAFDDVLAGPTTEPVDAQPWTPFCIAYTSGTTGPSKGAVIPTAHALHNQAGSQHVFGWHTADDVFFVCCPLFHVSGLLGGVGAAWLIGAFAYVADQFHASTFWAESDRVGGTVVFLVGTMAEFLLRQPPAPDDARHSLQKVVMLPLHPDAETFGARFAIRIGTAFGNTETGSFILCGDDEGLRRRSVGRPRPGFEVRLVDEHDLEVPTGEVGEVVMRPDQPWLCTTGYVNNQPASAAAWRNGWFHTGDALRRDDDGYFYFFDRYKDAIRRRGENISSFEVEREVVAHPDVVECVAVGIASSDLEQDVKIAVVRRPGSELTENELFAFLVDRLAYYMLPRYITFVDELPRTATAKVQKSVMRERGAAGCWDSEAAGVSVGRRR